MPLMAALLGMWVLNAIKQSYILALYFKMTCCSPQNLQLASTVPRELCWLSPAQAI